jgi:hypothetical protein
MTRMPRKPDPNARRNLPASKRGMTTLSISKGRKGALDAAARAAGYPITADYVWAVMRGQEPPNPGLVEIPDEN